MADKRVWHDGNNLASNKGHELSSQTEAWQNSSLCELQRKGFISKPVCGKTGRYNVWRGSRVNEGRAFWIFCCVNPAKGAFSMVAIVLSLLLYQILDNCRISTDPAIFIGNEGSRMEQEGHKKPTIMKVCCCFLARSSGFRKDTEWWNTVHKIYHLLESFSQF